MKYDRCQKEHITASALLGPSLVGMREHMELGVTAAITVDEDEVAVNSKENKLPEYIALYKGIPPLLN